MTDSLDTKPDGSDTLETVAGKVDALFDKVDQAERKQGEYRTAGQLLLEAKARVDAGEAGDNIRWPEWLAANVKRSADDCGKVMRLAAAANPEEAAAEERKKAREGMAAMRAKRAADKAAKAAANNATVSREPDDEDPDDEYVANRNDLKRDHETAVSGFMLRAEQAWRFAALPTVEPKNARQRSDMAEAARTVVAAWTEVLDRLSPPADDDDYEMAEAAE